ncbi:MAG: ankyrin repeat domain-containing protein [Christensenellales bacterium]
MNINRLFKAIENNENDLLKVNLTSKNINKKNKEGQTLIHQATICNNVEAIKLLLNLCVNVDIYDKKGFSALKYACYMDHVEAAELLMKYKLSLTWYEPMMLAASMDCCKTLRCLIGLGGDVNGYASDKEGYSLIHWAAQEGHIDVIKLLVEHGANPDLLDDSGHTPLYKSASEGHTDIVEYLLTCGVDIEGRLEKELNSTTPIMIACGWNKSKVVEVLIKNGANIEAKDMDGRTPLFYAVLRQNKNIVDILINNGADKNIKDLRGYTLNDLNNPEIRKAIDNEEYKQEN